MARSFCREQVETITPTPSPEERAEQNCLEDFPQAVESEAFDHWDSFACAPVSLGSSCWWW